MNQPRKRQHFTGICASIRKTYSLFLIRVYRAVPGKERMGQTGLVGSFVNHREDQEEFSLLNPCSPAEGLSSSPWASFRPRCLRQFSHTTRQRQTQSFDGWSSLTRGREEVHIFPLAWETGFESHISYFPGQCPSCCLTVLSSFHLIKLQLACLKRNAVKKKHKKKRLAASFSALFVRVAHNLVIRWDTETEFPQRKEGVV